MQSHEQAATNESSDDEDGILSFQQRNEDLLDPPSVTGIYPTPPDANRSHPVQQTNGRTNLGLDPDSIPQAQASKTSQKDVEDESLDMDMDLGTYDHLGDDDFFGDMEGGIYNNNGITEDDFDFFDDPGEGRQPIETLQSRHGSLRSEDIAQRFNSSEALGIDHVDAEVPEEEFKQSEHFSSADDIAMEVSSEQEPMDHHSVVKEVTFEEDDLPTGVILSHTKGSPMEDMERRDREVCALSWHFTER